MSSKGIVRPVTDRALGYLKADVLRPAVERSIKDIIDAEEWIPGLISRIESDREWMKRVQDENRFLRSLLTPDQILRSLLDKAE